MGNLKWPLFLLIWIGISAAEEWELVIPGAQNGQIVVDVGDSKTLYCIIRGDKGPSRLSWTFPNGTEHISSSLRIRNADDSASGVYKCSATMFDEDKSAEITLVIRDLPKFLSVEIHQSAKIGEQSIISCPTTNANSLFWMKDGRQLFTTERMIIAEPNKDLIFQNFTLEDNGKYICHLMASESGNDYESREIEVSGIASPRILEFLGPKEVLEDRDAKFHCSAFGVPQPKVQWFRATQSKSFEKIEPSEKYLLNGDSMTIREANADDIGRYICRALNEAGNAEESVELNVFLKPRIQKQKSIFSNLTETVQIDCRAFGNETLIEWLTADMATVFNDTLEGISVRTEASMSTLIVENVSAEKNNHFVCIAENKAGRDTWDMHITLTQSPRIHSWSQPLRMLAGKGFTLRCDGNGVPDLEWVWTLNGNRVDADISHFVINSSAIFSELSVRPNAQVYGDYQCEAKNTLGSDRSAVISVILVSPPNLPLIFCDSENWLPNRILCVVDFGGVADASMPTHYIVELSDEQTRNLSIPRNGNELLIRNLKPQTNYQMRLMAENEAGSSDWSDTYELETTEAKSPEPAANFSVQCDEIKCAFVWAAAEDNGSPVTAYNFIISKANVTDENAFVSFDFSTKTKKESPYFNKTTLEQSVDVYSLSIADYKAAVFAINQIGRSNASVVEFHVNEMVSSSRVFWIVLICSIILFAVLAVFIFFYVRRDQSNGKGTKPEQSSAENVGLLESGEQKTSWKHPKE